MGLREYKAKRNFRRTREPAGEVRPSADKDPFFVIQKHDATRLHYDFRLEMEGVLKSWAVPKGFPMKRGDRRLAVEVEDHPISYAKFEGTIPPGNYGAGTVMVWDIGTYQVEGEEEPVRALKNGKLHFTLKGKKLKGEWALVRMRPREHENKPQWLMFKSGDDAPELSARVENQSVLTNRSLGKIAKDNDTQWQSNRSTKSSPERRAPARREPRKAAKRAERVLGAPKIELGSARLPKRKAEFVEPMKASLVETLPKGEDWLYEIKFDGVRALAIKRGKEIELISRNEKSFTTKYHEVTDALKQLPCREAILDGEVAALDQEGRSSFQLLQAHQMPGTERPAIFYYVFDVIQLEGKDLTQVPLLKRKAMAQELVKNLPDTVRFSASIQADSGRLLKEMKARGLEGLIAKKKDSNYEIGRRSGAWVKFKWTNEQEFVIGGYSEPRGARSHFGALVVGYYDQGKLMFAAKVGTGFNQKLLKSLHGKFQKLIRPDCPFVNLPEKAGRFGRGLTAAEMRRCTWLEPKLVCQIRFAEWTRDHHLRQPAFLGLREDKKASEVVRESPRS
ncbi:MAG: bifunctional non-ous end joining protein LigD [Verrucomicrobiota bacterium]|jgi:bifunctional non-homologous end joining protein LigD